MADIRPELRERLTDRLKQRAALLHDLESVDEEIKAIEVLYQMERNKYGVLKGFPMRARVTEKLSARGFILDAVSDGNIWTLAALRDKATQAGYFRDSASPGRSVQGILMGLAKQREIQKAGDTGWIKT